MSNKQQLQEHNTDLSSILSIAEGLPLEEVIKALASTGKYLWEKYTLALLDLEVHFNSNGTANMGFDISQQGVDVNKLKKSDLVGCEIYTTYDTSEYIKFISDTQCIVQSDYNQETVQWQISDGFITIDYPLYSLADENWWYDVEFIAPNRAVAGVLIGYAVSDNEEQYPDDGAQDGFWWEKVTSMLTADYGTVTIKETNSKAITDLKINHNLGTVPSKFYLFPNGTINPPTGDIGYYPADWGAVCVTDGSFYGVSTYSSYSGTITVYPSSGIINKTDTFVEISIPDSNRHPALYSGEFAWLVI